MVELTTDRTIVDVQDEIISEFEMLPDWTEKYKYIIELGQESPDLPEEYKTNDRKIKGCQSNVWLNTNLDGEKIIYEGDSDAMITRGLINLLIRVYSGRTPDEIIQTKPYFIDRIDMRSHLSQTRANGLASMVKKMKIYAMAYKTKLGNNQSQ